MVRQGKPDPFDVKLTRDVIRIKSVKWEMQGEDIGYIRISSFNEQTQEGLDGAMAAIKAKAGDKLKGYIIDLRNNPGGLLEAASGRADAAQAADFQSRAAIQMLITEHEMGELFKVIGFVKGEWFEALGFTHGDRCHML